jgi:hypothetical protein
VSALVGAGLLAALPAWPAAGPVGGGVDAGTNIDELPTRRVSTPLELYEVLRSDFRGRVIVPAGVSWEMAIPCGARDELGRCVNAPMMNIPLRDGVQLVGERGPLGSRPILYTNYRLQSYNLFAVQGNDVLVRGIQFRGPAAGLRDAKKLPYGVAAIEVYADPGVDDPAGKGEANRRRTFGRNIVIRDSEFNEWISTGVGVTGAVRFPRGEVPTNYTGPRVRPEDAGLVRIEGNYFHHNARDSLGYGVVLSGNAYATIEGNVFNFNRHAVAADGTAFNGYVARFNYVLEGGYKYGNGYYGQHFDVHGAGTPESRANGHYDGGPAGEKYDVSQNTIRGEQDYGGFLGIAEKTRAAFELRGRPAIGAEFNANVVVHDDFGEAVRLKRGSDKSLDTSKPSTFNLRRYAGNRYDTDYSTDIAAGDFDADGRTDVFLANGTGWFFSSAGIRPWEYLRPSNKRTRELAFADVDNDGVTDVLYREPNGRLGYAKGGRGAVLALTTTPAGIADLRFGDFDGDGLTDIFQTQRGQWSVWYGRTRAWTPAQTSSKSISDLLFGEFDEVKGTDVVAVLSGGWSFSSGATRSWARLNGKLVSSFDKATAADVDGNGRTDIVVGDSTRWRWSRDGRSPLAVLRTDRSLLLYPSLKRMLVGRFDGGSRDVVVTFEVERSTTRGARIGTRLVAWRGLGTGNAFTVRSPQDMR